MIKWFKKKWMMKLCFTFTAFSLDCNEHKSFYKPAIRPPWKYYGWSKYAQMSFLHLYNILCRYFIKKIIQRKGDKFHRQQMFCIQPHDDIDRNVKKTNDWFSCIRYISKNKWSRIFSYMAILTFFTENKKCFCAAF